MQRLHSLSILIHKLRESHARNLLQPKILAQGLFRAIPSLTSVRLPEYALDGDTQSSWKMTDRPWFTRPV